MADGRAHLVLIPGFAGFDALGQLEYYAGVTPQFRRWRRGHPAGARAVLHYFDNFPTAGVALRARRLARFLAKRLARGEFQPGDRVALIGHSTGGLDIRQLFLALAARDTPIRVDGPAHDHVAVEPDELLDLLRDGRIVFLSVPQYGTNIADWVRSHRLERRLAVTGLGASVTTAQQPFVEVIPEALAAAGAALTGSGAALAMQDTLREIAHEPGSADPEEAAAAREAAALVELWLGHMTRDFGAIDDLACTRDGGPPSPAQLRPGERAGEPLRWAELGIASRSYATLAPRAFDFPDGARVSPWGYLSPAHALALATRALPRDAPDLLHLVCYRGCAGGPFTAGIDEAVDAAARTLDLRDWDNDGIVNTASMLWPHGADTVLVEGDHMDVVGHFAPAPARAGSRRRHDAYDLLGSRAGFGADAFAGVWDGIFEFCAA